jgi:hypothetical protein
MNRTGSQTRTLIGSLPRRMEWRFSWRQVPVQLVPQPRVELARCFPFDARVVAEEFDSVLKLSDSGRRFFQTPNELQQLPQPLLVEFLREQGVLPALVLQGRLVALTRCSSAGIHPASPSTAQFDFAQGIIAARCAHADLLTTTNHAFGLPSLKTSSLGCLCVAEVDPNYFCLELMKLRDYMRIRPHF